MTINQRVKEVRKYFKLPQSTFAKKICISSGYLGGIETENKKVNPRVVRLVCDTFNIREEWLLNGSGEMFKTDSVLNNDIDLLNKFHKLDPEYQNTAIDLVENILNLQKRINKDNE